MGDAKRRKDSGFEYSPDSSSKSFRNIKEKDLLDKHPGTTLTIGELSNPLLNGYFKVVGRQGEKQMYVFRVQRLPERYAEFIKHNPMDLVIPCDTELEIGATYRGYYNGNPFKEKFPIKLIVLYQDFD